LFISIAGVVLLLRRRWQRRARIVMVAALSALQIEHVASLRAVLFGCFFVQRGWGGFVECEDARNSFVP
jgi:hypothetical protein